MAQLSPAALRRGRRGFHLFNSFNSASFVLLSGSFVTLYALSLGASKATIGLLSSFTYVTYFFLPLGKRLVPRSSIMTVFGWAWFWRFVSVTPALLAPLFISLGQPALAFGALTLGLLLFNVLRGVGMVGNNPVLANLADGGMGGKRADRGAYLVNVSIVCNVAALLGNLVVALVIGKSAPSWVFALSMGIAIVIGIIGSLILLRQVPEPAGYKSAVSGSLLKNAREAFREKGFRAFMEALFLLAFVAGMARSFLPVYAKEVFHQGDDAVMLYSLITSLGSIVMGLFARLLVDRLGAKPLFVLFTAAAVLSLLPLVFAPGPEGILASALPIAILLCFANFLSSFGLSGEENVGQTYFFSLVRPELTLDLGIVYFLVYGLGGTLGSGLGGFVLDTLGGLGLSGPNSYRVFFGFLVAILLWVIFRSPRLVALGSISVRESLGAIFSPRDIRAFNLLSRLDKSADPSEEMNLIRGIGEAGFQGASSGASLPAQSTLLAYLGSPRFDVRLEALLALENLGELSRPAMEALANEVERQPYTTAYLAARILGKACPEPQRVLPILRKAAASAEDYMLRGSAVVALARLGDRQSRTLIEDVLLNSPIPRVRISAAYALEILGSSDSVPALLSCLRKEGDPAFVSDELILSTATIAGIMPRFYSLYQDFLADDASGIAALEDAADSVLGRPEVPARAAFEAALKAIFAESSDGSGLGKLLLSRGAAAAGSRWPIDLLLSEAALDPAIAYRGLKFLIAAYAILRLRD